MDLQVFPPKRISFMIFTGLVESSLSIPKMQMVPLKVVDFKVCSIDCAPTTSTTRSTPCPLVTSSTLADHPGVLR